MFEVRIAKPIILKNVLESIMDLFDNAIFDCNNSGISLQAMDASSIASVVFLTLRSDGFDSFHCDRKLPLGINLDSVVKILNYAENDMLTLKVQDESNTVTLMLESQNIQKISYYELRLLNVYQLNSRMPHIKHTCMVRLPSIEFQSICSNLAQFSESIVICCTEERVKFSASGDIGSANVKLVKSKIIIKEEDAVFIDVDKPATLRVACNYLNAFTKATPVSKQVQLSFSEDMPLIVEYAISSLGFIRFYLTPLI